MDNPQNSSTPLASESQVKSTVDSLPPQNVSKKKMPMMMGVVLLLIILLAGAAFAFKYIQKPAMAPEEPMASVVPVETTESSMEGWKTYTDSVFGFSFQYPADFDYVQASGDRVIFTQQNTPSQQLTFNVLTKADLSSDQILEDYKKKLIDIETTNINSGLKVKGLIEGFENPMSFLGGLFPVKDKGTVVFESEDNDIDEKTFNQIFSTFKSIQSDNLEVKNVECVNGIYKDDVVGFSIQCDPSLKAYIQNDYFDQFLMQHTRRVSFCEGNVKDGYCEGAGITIWANGDGWGGGCDPENHAKIMMDGKERDYCLFDTGFGQLYAGELDPKPGTNRYLLGGSFSSTFTQAEGLKLLETFKTY